MKYKDKTECRSQSLAEKFSVRKTWILSIFKNWYNILWEFETNEPFTSKEVIVKQVMK